MSERISLLKDLKGLREVVDFKKNNDGELPKRVERRSDNKNKKDNEDDERNREKNRLANRVGRYKKRFKDGRLPPIMIDRVKGAGISLDIREEREDDFNDKLKAYKLFVRKIGHTPRRYSEDINEEKLYQFIYRCRLGYKNELLIANGKAPFSNHRLSEKRKERLLRAGIVLDIKEQKEKELKINLDAIVKWRETHGKTPSLYKPSNEEEHRLALYLHSLRIAYKNMKILERGGTPTSTRRISPEIMAKLEELNLILDLDAKFMKQVDECIQYIKNNGRKPRLRGNDISEEEKRLNRRIRRWRFAYLQKIKEIIGLKTTTRMASLTLERLKILVDNHILEDECHLLGLDNNDPQNRSISERDAMVCFQKKKDMSIRQCGESWLNANAFQQRDNICFKCNQGGSIRNALTSNNKSSRKKRIELGIIDNPE